MANQNDKFRRLTHRTLDQRFMREALSLAARIPRRCWPNPPVGAVVVRGNRIVGRGAHLGPHEPHAERVALAQAGAAAHGATLYCTLEPCNHQGRTEPCAPAVVASGVSRVVLGMIDPNPQVAGGGIAVLRKAGIEVTLGVSRTAALELIWPFVTTAAFTRPYVELKTATSLDDRFTPSVRPADQPDGPVYLTGSAARHDVHVRRRWVDLVLVGERTAATDQPHLDGRLVTAADDCPAAEPTAGYVDTDLSLTTGLPRSAFVVFAGQNTTTAAQAVLTGAGGRVVVCREHQGHVDPQALLEQAMEQGFQTIMVEGGPRLAAAFLQSDCVDRWVRYLAPVVTAGGVRWPDNFQPTQHQISDFSLTGAERCGADLRVIHDRTDFDATLARLTDTDAGLER